MTDNKTLRCGKDELSEQQIKEANQCIGIGAGVGALGTLSAVALGATCPLCFVISPALIGTGMFKRYRKKHKTKK